MADEEKIVILGDLGGAENYQLPDPALMAYYEDIQNRTFWLTNEITTDTYDLVQYIVKINRDDKDIPINQRKPIRIMFNSNGGNLDVADTLCSIIELSKTPIFGYAMGMVASAASLIYLSCHKKYTLSTAYFIVHKGSANMSGNYNEMKAAMDDYQRQIDRLVETYIDKTKYPSEVIEEKIKTDWYIHADEALEYGMVDEMLVNMDTLY